MFNIPKSLAQFIVQQRILVSFFLCKIIQGCRMAPYMTKSRIVGPIKSANYPDFLFVSIRNTCTLCRKMKIFIKCHQQQVSQTKVTENGVIFHMQNVHYAKRVI